MDDPGAIAAHVSTLRDAIHDRAGLDISSARSLTAFTSGIPYGAAYDRPVGHVPDRVAADVVLREPLVQGQASTPSPISLMVDSGELDGGEIAQSRSRLGADAITVVLRDDAATKLAVLILMHVLPVSLQVIVAHGGRERFYDERWVARDEDGTHRVVTVHGSSREVIADPGVELVRRLSRTITGSSATINGVELADALLTADDLGLFGAVPVESEIVVNNGCATWTALADAFHRWSGSGYVGTLWPVADRHVRRVSTR